MALSKLALKLVKGLMKKKKQGKSYSDQVKPKPKTKAKPKSKGKGPDNNTKYNVKGPITRGKKELRKILGEPKNTKAEKVVGKRKTKPAKSYTRDDPGMTPKEIAAEKKEILDDLKGRSQDYLRDLARGYISGGGFGDIRKMTKSRIIKILMSGKTSYYSKGGKVKKKK